MSYEDRRLSLLLRQIHDKESPEEEYTKIMTFNMVIFDVGMLFIMFLSFFVRDVVLLLFAGSLLGCFIFAYLWQLSEKKQQVLQGKHYLDCQIIIADDEIGQQIPIKGYKYLNVPEETIEGKKITYEKRYIDEIRGMMKSGYIRVGGKSPMRPEVVDDMVEGRLKDLKTEADARALEALQREQGEKTIIGKIIDFIPFIGPSKVRKVRRIGDAEAGLVDRTSEVSRIKTGDRDAEAED